MKAVWQNAVIAESDDTVEVEGNIYFPRLSLDNRYLVESPTRSTCPWKGTAHYYSLNVDGRLNPDAVWYYPDPKQGAEIVAGRAAFWRGVAVEA